MAYVVQSTEKVRGTGADFETKAMLYLMCFRDDSNEISYFAIDFYNDVTGLSIHADKAWDVQSKGTKKVSAKEIGRELVTLFKNEMSDLNFDYLILFMSSVPESFRKDASKNHFGIDNIEDKSFKSLREGLVSELNKRTSSYIDAAWITDCNIDSFLKKVTFVIDDKTKADYIKGIISVNPKYIQNDNILDGIFNIIRDKQAGKKNSKSVEGEIVSHLRDVNLYGRTLTSKEIRLMVLNSLVNHDVIKAPAPHLFYQLINNFDGIEQKNLIEECKLNISSVLFDKTYSDEFWELLDLICNTLYQNRDLSVKETFEKLSNHKAVKNPRLTDFTVIYLISVIKEALFDY